jgi:hypothetical protein
MPEVRLTGKPLEQRIADRLKPSAGNNSGADVTAVHGTGPTRTITSIHKGAGHLTPSNAQHERGQDGWSKKR